MRGRSHLRYARPCAQHSATVLLDGEIVTVGELTTLTVTAVVAEHPLEVVTVTEYVAAELITSEAAVLFVFHR